MRTRLISSIAIAALALTACGGGASGSQGEVADLMLEEADKEGIELEADCVKDVAGKLSDDDAEKLLEAGVDGDPQLSADGEALADDMIGCLDTDALVDSMIAPLVEEMGEENVDVDCLKDAFRDIDPANIDDDPAFATAMLECVDLDLGG
jgi:hypothetical protein